MPLIKATDITGLPETKEGLVAKATQLAKVIWPEAVLVAVEPELLHHRPELTRMLSTSALAHVRLDGCSCLFLIVEPAEARRLVSIEADMIMDSTPQYWELANKVRALANEPWAQDKATQPAAATADLPQPGMEAASTTTRCKAIQDGLALYCGDGACEAEQLVPTANPGEYRCGRCRRIYTKCEGKWSAPVEVPEESVCCAAGGCGSSQRG